MTLIIARFTANGVPSAGLNPTISITRETDGALVVDSAPMPPAGAGITARYVYQFAESPGEQYSYVCDAGTASVDQRYLGGVIDSAITDIAADVAAIRAKTDPLPVDLLADIQTAILAAMDDLPAVALPVMQGGTYSSVALQSRELRIVRGDTPRITFDLRQDYSGWVVFFASKINTLAQDYAISPKQGIWTDAVMGQGYVALAATDTANSGKYLAELELRNGDQRLTVMQFVLTILADVISG